MTLSLCWQCADVREVPLNRVNPEPITWRARGDFVSRLLMATTGVIVWLTGVISIFTESP